jgi:arabinose-5-phosphate isomerase
MNQNERILATARACIGLEKEALGILQSQLDDRFVQAVNSIYHCAGRVVVTGIGKSALIGQKIVATLNSTGTPALFMHAADALHGDLGMLQATDIVLAISKSGETAEMKALLSPIKQHQNTLIAMTSNDRSSLALASDIVLLTPAVPEADLHQLAPTTSTVAQLALGDAIAVALLDLRQFSASDFARNHPGGALGKQLTLQVAILAARHAKPHVIADAPVREVIMQITKGRMGAVAVVSPENAVLGIITDGDIRRMLEHETELQGICAQDLMHTTPKCVPSDSLAVHALALMQAHAISQVVVLDAGTGAYAGMVHVHDLLREGL